MDYKKKLKEIEEQIKKVETQANATINQLIGQKELLKQLIKESDE